MLRHVVTGVQVAVLAVTLFAVVMLFANEPGGPPSFDYAEGFPEAQVAADLYASSCAGCHGADGGGGIGPALQGVEERLSVEEQTAVIVEGRGGMPSFGSRLTDTQIEFLVRFTRELL